MKHMKLMKRSTLHIRGIPWSDIVRYVEQMGGRVEKNPTGDDEKTTNVQGSDRTCHVEGVQVKGPGWTCQVGQQQTFFFMQSEIPEISVTFEAESEQTLTEVVRHFRLKTLRAGG